MYNQDICGCCLVMVSFLIWLELNCYVSSCHDPQYRINEGATGACAPGPELQRAPLKFEMPKRNYCKQMLLKIINNFQSDTV